MLRHLLIVTLALVPFIGGCAHTEGDCSHVNDISVVARPSTLTLLTPSGGSGLGLSAGDSFVAAAGPTQSDLTVIWRSCRGLNRLTVTETPTTVIVDVEVSGCPGYQGAKEPPPSGDVWLSRGRRRGLDVVSEPRYDVIPRHLSISTW